MPTNISATDIAFLRRALALAVEAEGRGNLPIGAVIVIDRQVVAEGRNSILFPRYDPGAHAEVSAVRAMPVELWPRAAEMTCYTTLEPCVMCFGTLLLHGVGRVVFGSEDPEGGARCLLAHLPPYYASGGVPQWHGPGMAEECDPLFARANARFRELPCGRV